MTGLAASPPPLRHWIGLDGCPVFDELWHLTPCAVAPVPLGRLAQSATSLSEPLSIFVSLPFLLLFLTFQVWVGVGVSPGSQMAPAVARRLLSKQTEQFAGSQFFPFHSSLPACCLFVPFAYHLRRPTAGSSVSQPVSRCMSESVSQVSWLSDVLSRDVKRRPLPVMCQVLSWQTDANDSGKRKCVTPRYPHALSCASVTPPDKRRLTEHLICFGACCRRLSTF